MSILEVNELSKIYRDVHAVDQVSLSIEKGTIFGLLGPNGAGKTSLIRMITQITNPDSGSILFDGEALKADHIHHIGYMPEERGLYKKMTVGDHLIYLANLRNVNTKEAKVRIEEWFERLHIGDWWKKKVNELSKGMQQKIQFISTVIHKPKLVILDEPFSGLDPINANLIREEIGRMVKEEDMSVIFSTHRMEQVEQICSQIALINKGRKILDGSVEEIKQTYKKDTFLFEFANGVGEQFRAHDHIINKTENSVILQGIDYQTALNILQTSIAEGKQLLKFEEILPSINEVFINLVTAKSTSNEE